MVTASTLVDHKILGEIAPTKVDALLFHLSDWGIWLVNPTWRRTSVWRQHLRVITFVLSTFSKFLKLVTAFWRLESRSLWRVKALVWEWLLRAVLVNSYSHFFLGGCWWHCIDRVVTSILHFPQSLQLILDDSRVVWFLELIILVDDRSLLNVRLNRLQLLVHLDTKILEWYPLFPVPWLKNAPVDIDTFLAPVNSWSEATLSHFIVIPLAFHHFNLGLFL